MLQIDLEDDEARREEVLRKCDGVDASEDSDAYLGGESPGMQNLVPGHAVDACIMYKMAWNQLNYMKVPDYSPIEASNKPTGTAITHKLLSHTK